MQGYKHHGHGHKGDGHKGEDYKHHGGYKGGKGGYGGESSYKKEKLRRAVAPSRPRRQDSKQ